MQPSPQPPRVFNLKLPTGISPLTLFALCLCAPGIVVAHCKRPVQVPMSATGQSVVIEGDTVRGIYPELLSALSAKEKCRFVISPVPRARLEKLFESGQADMIVASTRSARRDQFGVFIPMIRSRATAITLEDSARPPFRTTQEILDSKEVRLVVVRGYDYGPNYHELLDAMAKENRLLLEAEPTAVARLMRVNPHDITIMVPTIIYGAMQEDSRLQDDRDKLRFEPLDNLPWGESGVYLSKTSMDPAMFKHLQAALQRATISGVVYKGFAGYYPPHVLKDSIKPLDRATP